MARRVRKPTAARISTRPSKEIVKSSEWDGRAWIEAQYAEEQHRLRVLREGWHNNQRREAQSRSRRSLEARHLNETFGNPVVLSRGLQLPPRRTRALVTREASRSRHTNRSNPEAGSRGPVMGRRVNRGSLVGSAKRHTQQPIRQSRKPKKCKRCLSTPWTCGVCGISCCLHRCTDKQTSGSAVCITCAYGEQWGDSRIRQSRRSGVTSRKAYRKRKPRPKKRRRPSKFDNMRRVVSGGLPSLGKRRP
jgi:hypothetical protein